MKLIVNPHTTELKQTPVNEKEINITKIEFEFKDIPQEYVKKAFFTLDGNTYVQLIENNECTIPYEVLSKKGDVEIGVIAYELDNNEYVARYNPTPSYFDTLIGSLKDKYENSEEVTPTDKEQMEQALQSGLNDIQEAITQANNLDIDVEKTGNTTRLTITKQDETQETVNIFDGTNGQDGVGLQYNWSGTSLGIKREDEQNYDYVNLKGDKGDAGSVKFIVVQQLPTQNIDTTAIYLVPSQTTASQNNYEEYIYVNNNWEKLGEVPIEVDLSDYYTKEQTNALIPTNSDFTLNGLSEKSYNNLTDKPTIPIVPTNVSAFTNDAGYLTQHQDISGKQDVMQYSTIPTASADYLNKIIQFTGTTNNTYTNGYFYKCVSDGQSIPTYSWTQINIQPQTDISGKLDTSKVKNAISTTAGDVYDVRYVNSLIGDINTILATLTTPNINGGN